MVKPQDEVRSGLEVTSPERGVPAQKPVTLAMVAKHAQVHYSTVSRALSPNPTGIGADTVKRVRELATLLGYRRDEGAAALKRGRSRLIGVLVPRLTDVALATLYAGIDDAASLAGYDTVVANTWDEAERRRSRLDSLLSRRVDGIILADSHIADHTAHELSKLGLPCVLAMRRLPSEVSVSTDDLAGGRLAAEHLISRGHTQVGIIAGDITASTGIERSQGFTSAYRESGMDVPQSHIIASGFGALAGYEACRKLLELPERPTAIFAADDLTAVGAMGAIRDAGLRIRNDIAIIGYNDIDISKQLPIPLTTIRSPLLEMGRASLKKLLDRISGRPVDSELLKPELIVRSTT
ncbi:LacI family DNA-binding transcriptional regulator [Paenarthrobacter sp. YJN-5]|uniref:LacI family DNA-binding transcriptional regulator n=1 Tax=Paenarthrobacter sp. YJN-5 TaxID=2735316 RepID=UPI001877B5CE|nr:LacI family DNA-binding transcriptional regulator [Paenarthrobacter sp. YJN-5]QOT19835.1 LacI family DNA-binding transcriptional regulator [Paenarthrobacter sp. YJN-5]